MEKVHKAIFSFQETEMDGIPQRQFIVLKNNDFLTGKILNDELTIVTTYAKVPLKLNDAESVTLIGESTPLTKVVMRNSDVLQGVLETEDLSISLDIGPDVKIYKDRIKVIHTREGFRP